MIIRFHTMDEMIHAMCHRAAVHMLRWYTTRKKAVTCHDFDLELSNYLKRDV